MHIPDHWFFTHRTPARHSATYARHKISPSGALLGPLLGLNVGGPAAPFFCQAISETILGQKKILNWAPKKGPKDGPLFGTLLMYFYQVVPISGRFFVPCFGVTEFQTFLANAVWHVYRHLSPGLSKYLENLCFCWVLRLDLSTVFLYFTLYTLIK